MLSIESSASHKGALFDAEDERLPARADPVLRWRSTESRTHKGVSGSYSTSRTRLDF
jgi:hypothetical protein